MGELGYINGIGSVTEKKLNKLNIYTIEDLVNYYPYRYEILKKTSLDDENDLNILENLDRPSGRTSG